jgi:hypothetical protein
MMASKRVREVLEAGATLRAMAAQASRTQTVTAEAMARRGFQPRDLRY